MIRYVCFYDSRVHGSFKYCIGYDVASCCCSRYPGVPLYKRKESTLKNQIEFIFY